MYNRPEQILEKYDLEIKSVSKGRDSYNCETDQGQKVLKEYRGSMERAEFLADMLSHLKREGMRVETVVRTAEGTPFAVNEDGVKYMLVDSFAGAECDTKSRSDMLAAARFLADLHNASMRYPGEVPEFVRTENYALLHLYEKHNRELNKVKNYVRSRKKKNEFEMMFAGQYSGFMEKALSVTAQLKRMEQGEELFGFCHGDYNQHNVIFAEQGPCAVHFENFSYQVRISDLANFIRKMMEKNNWNTGLGLDLIRAYDGGRKLSDTELRYLYLSLAYPEKFWKIANHYYNSHKAWLSGRNIEKLERVIAQEDAREQFLELLFHFTA